MIHTWLIHTWLAHTWLAHIWLIEAGDPRGPATPDRRDAASPVQDPTQSPLNLDNGQMMANARPTTESSSIGPMKRLSAELDLLSPITK